MLPRLLSLAMLLAVVACSATTQPEDLTGAWGGRSVALLVTGAGGVLEYDCAAGTIDQPLQPEAGGRFSATGTHTPGQGGPVREGDIPEVFPARYDGEVSGDTMTLTVTLVASGQSVGAFTLTRDASPRLTRCL